MTSKTPPPVLLVTIGSTLFPSLTDRVLSPAFLSRISHLGAEELAVQYGRAELTFPPNAEWMERDHKAGTGRFTFQPSVSDQSNAGSGRTHEGGPSLSVRVMRYTDDFEGLVRGAKWVISHAGSGSILTVLRTPRPLLVVPNTDLMDNHQAELANALKEGGYLLVSTIPALTEDVSRLIHDSTDKSKLTPFPPIDKQKFACILDETAGFMP